ncbi:MAG: hypothetical protein QNL80_14660 [Akkermansiaceae bacterium]
MNIPGFTTSALLEFHSKVSECLKIDDANPAPSKLYGVREFADWKQLSDAIEGELSKREASFSAINWQ